MNIINRTTAHCDKDPFDCSDRNWSTGAGKGDAPRNVSGAFKTGYERIDWSGNAPEHGRKITRKTNRTIIHY